MLWRDICFNFVRKLSGWDVEPGRWDGKPCLRSCLFHFGEEVFDLIEGRKEKKVNTTAAVKFLLPKFAPKIEKTPKGKKKQDPYPLA